MHYCKLRLINIYLLLFFFVKDVMLIDIKLNFVEVDLQNQEYLI